MRSCSDRAFYWRLWMTRRGPASPTRLDLMHEEDQLLTSHSLLSIQNPHVGCWTESNKVRPRSAYAIPSISMIDPLPPSTKPSRPCSRILLRLRLLVRAVGLMNMAGLSFICLIIPQVAPFGETFVSCKCLILLNTGIFLQLPRSNYGVKDLSHCEDLYAPLGLV